MGSWLNQSDAEALNYKEEVKNKEDYSGYR